MKWLTKSKLGKTTLILGGLLLLLAVFAGLVHTRSKSGLEQYTDKLRAAGEKLTMAELLPPPIPPGRNGSELLGRAGSQVNFWQGVLGSNPPPAMRMMAPGKAMIGWQQPYICYGNGSNSWDEANLELDQNGPALELLAQMIDRPQIEFDFDPRQPLDVRLTNLVAMKPAVLLLSAATLADLHQGRTESALTNMHAALAIMKGSQDHPFLVSQLVRYSIGAVALTMSWELLQSPGLSDESLARLQKEWSEIEFVSPMENALAFERAYNQLNFARLRSSNSPMNIVIAIPAALGGGPGSPSVPGDWMDQLAELGKSAVQGARQKTAETLWRVSWSYEDELRAMEGQQITIEAARRIQTNGFFKDALVDQDRRLKALGIGGTNGGRWEWLVGKIDEEGLRTYFSQEVVSLGRVLERLMRTEAARQLLVTAIALKRYQLRHGSYPADLRALTPEFLPAVPRDPVDGQPLRYRPNPDGTFLLYSIGNDFKDDGGDPTSGRTRGWDRGRDWVWPRPATAMEIQDYLDEMPSPRP